MWPPSQSCIEGRVINNKASLLRDHFYPLSEGIAQNGTESRDILQNHVEGEGKLIDIGFHHKLTLRVRNGLDIENRLLWVCIHNNKHDKGVLFLRLVQPLLHRVSLVSKTT